MRQRCVDFTEENLQLLPVLLPGRQLRSFAFKGAVDFLGEKLNKMLQGRSDREVYLKADKNIPYGIVVQVMAEIKKSGIDQLGMITEPAVLKKISDASNTES